MDRFQRVKLLGRGAYGSAVLVRDKVGGSQLRVVKEIDLSKIPAAAQREAQREADVLRSLSHSNIVAYHDTFFEGSRLCIVMEFADGGDLSGAVAQRKGAGERFAEGEALALFAQCCGALRHVHDKRILHRDLKCQNIFMTKAGSAKLGDFGIAKVLDHTGAEAHTMIGTPIYLAPEVCLNQPYGTRADIWSLGVVLYEVLALQQPFKADNIAALIMKILNAAPGPVPPELYSKEVQNLVSWMLEKLPQMRPDADQLLAQPVVQRVSGSEGHGYPAAARAGNGGAPGVTAAGPGTAGGAGRGGARSEGRPPAAPAPGTIAAAGAGRRGAPAPPGARVHVCARAKVRSGSAREVVAKQKTSQLSAPPSTNVAAKVIRVAPVRTQGRPTAPVALAAAVPQASPGCGPRGSVARDGAAAEELRRRAVREVLDLPDKVVPKPVGRRNVPSVRQLLELEVQIGGIGAAQAAAALRPSAPEALAAAAAITDCISATSPAEAPSVPSTLDELSLLEQVVPRPQPAAAEATEVDTAEVDLDEATRLLRPSSRSNESRGREAVMRPPKLPQSQADAGETTLLPSSTWQDGAGGSGTGSELDFPSVYDASLPPSLRLLRPIGSGGDGELTACSVFGNSLMYSNDSLEYTTDDLNDGSSVGTDGLDVEFPTDAIVCSGDIHDCITEGDGSVVAVAGDSFSKYGDENLGGVGAPGVGTTYGGDVEQGEERTLRLTTSGGAAGACVGHGAGAEMSEACPDSAPELPAMADWPAATSPVGSQPVALLTAATPASSPMLKPALGQRAKLERRAHGLGAQIERLRADVVRDLDAPARDHWEELYSLFKEKLKMAADLSDEEQSGIDRFIFGQLPRDDMDSIWRVYQVLHLEQELQFCQRQLVV